MQVVVRKNGHPLPPALDAAYTYGRSFDVQVVVNRRVLVYFNGTKRFDYPFTDLSGTGRSIYLKAGDYLQANTSTASASDYGDVELRLPTGASHFLTRSNAAPSAPVVGPPPAPPSSSPSTASTDPSPNGPPGNWGLAWRDDFNGDHLDTSRWHAHNGWKTNNVTTSSFPANVAVSGGQLTLTLTSPDTGAEIASAPYAGAGPNGYALEVGDYVEASVRFPGDGKNLYNWPAWWASGPN